MTGDRVIAQRTTSGIGLNKYEVKLMLIDTKSLINLITLDVCNMLELDTNNLTKFSHLLVGLGDKTVAV